MTAESHILSIEHAVRSITVWCTMFRAYMIAYCRVNNIEL
jgi:hypothetical protein